MVNDIKRNEAVCDLPRAARIIAKTVRTVTVPSLLIGALLTLLYCRTDTVFLSPSSYIMSLVFLAVIPTLSYGVWAVVPKWRREGRQGQRRIAFVFSLAGYTGGLLYGIFANVSRDLMVIFATYFLSVVLLTVFNKVFRFHASGHGCSVTGPLLLPAYFISPAWILPCLLMLGMVYLSSIVLKRHTLKELTAGSATAVVAFALCALLL